MKISAPPVRPHRTFHDADAAVQYLKELYAEATRFLVTEFEGAMASEDVNGRIRAFYPELRFETSSYAQVDTRLSFGHVSSPGEFATTITRPDLFENYLRQQIGLLIANHKQPVSVGPSTTPIPLHFAVTNNTDVAVPQQGAGAFTLRDVFDVPDLATTNDDIVNGTYVSPNGIEPLAPFSAQRVDYSLARLSHYTATDPEHFQNYVLFTNYQFYVSEFEAYARSVLDDPATGYTAFVSTGNAMITPSNGCCRTPEIQSIFSELWCTAWNRQKKPISWLSRWVQ